MGDEGRREGKLAMTPVKRKEAAEERRRGGENRRRLFASVRDGILWTVRRRGV